MPPPTGLGSAAPAASPNPPEVLGSAALAASPTDSIFPQSLRLLIDNPELSEGVYDLRVWQHQGSTPVRLGRYLSMALRHRARRLGMVLDQEGFVDMTDLLNVPQFRNACPIVGTLHWVVHTNPKQRSV